MSAHKPVLPAECLAILAPAAGETYADCTAGLGGHAALMAPALGPAGTVVLNDADPANLARAEERLRALGPRLKVFPGNFAQLPDRMAAEGLSAHAVLADLGFSSNQIDDPARGMSFAHDGPLDMRLDPTLPFSAADLVNTAPERELARILRDYGEERLAGPVARRIVAVRAAGKILTTSALAEIVRAVVPRSPGGIDPATRTFQALRIAVNDEIGVLDALLAAIERGARAVAAGRAGWLAPGARVAIIAFHSLEDRAVKRAFAKLESEGLAELLTDGPVVAGSEEIGTNPRARSGKLRAVRVGAGR